MNTFEYMCAQARLKSNKSWHGGLVDLERPVPFVVQKEVLVAAAELMRDMTSYQLKPLLIPPYDSVWLEFVDPDFALNGFKWAIEVRERRAFIEEVRAKIEAGLAAEKVELETVDFRLKELLEHRFVPVHPDDPDIGFFCRIFAIPQINISNPYAALPVIAESANISFNVTEDEFVQISDIKTLEGARQDMPLGQKLWTSAAAVISRTFFLLNSPALAEKIEGRSDPLNARRAARRDIEKHKPTRIKLHSDVVEWIKYKNDPHYVDERGQHMVRRHPKTYWTGPKDKPQVAVVRFVGPFPRGNPKRGVKEPSYLIQ